MHGTEFGDAGLGSGRTGAGRAREGYDAATIHYADGEGNEQAIPFTETASGYAYTLPEGVTEEQAMVEYFSTTRRGRGSGSLVV